MKATSEIKTSNVRAALDQLHADVLRLNMAPYWAVDHSVEHDEDRQILDTRKAVPYIWKYQSEIDPLLLRSAELIRTDTSDRRSLVLVNPGLAPKRATVSTMYVAFRLNDPREIMPPHRHAPNAIRLGLTGKMNFTGVEGENITFGPGDMVLTPHDTWHNHGNHGDDNAINLSVLDLPLVETLNSMYFEHDYTEEEEGKRVRRAMQSERFPPDYSQRVYGQGGLQPRFVSHFRGTGAASPMYVYRYDMMREQLHKFRDWPGDLLRPIDASQNKSLAVLSADDDVADAGPIAQGNGSNSHIDDARPRRLAHMANVKRGALDPDLATARTVEAREMAGVPAVRHVRSRSRNPAACAQASLTISPVLVLPCLW